MTVQPDLCRTCSETTLLVFSRDGSYHCEKMPVLQYQNGLFMRLCYAFVRQCITLMRRLYAFLGDYMSEHGYFFVNTCIRTSICLFK